MIRFVHLLRRREGMSHGEFREYWRDVHGPLIAFHQVNLAIIRYTQSHPLHDDAAGAAIAFARGLRGGIFEDPFDGVSELWFESESSLRAAIAGGRAHKEILASESWFLDRAASPSWFAHEYPQVSTLPGRPLAAPRSGTVKLHYFFRQRADMSMEDAQHYWKTAHGPLTRSHAVARGVICYQQVHRYDTSLADLMQGERKPVAPAYAGHAESWFDRLTARGGPEIDAAATQCADDEKNFIDWRASTYSLSKEFLLVDREWSL